MRIWVKTLLIGSSLILITLLIFNYRYPFISPGSNGWAIGFTQVDTPLQRIKPSAKNIITADSIQKASIYKTRFLADPFLFYENGVYYIFFEHQIENGPAKIGLFISKDGINYSFKGNIIDESFHLSFPQVFKHNGEYFILPETASINQVVLYKAGNFPFNWKIYDTLIKNTRLKDPAILISDSLNLITGMNNEWSQEVYRSKSLFGEWKIDRFFRSKKGNEIRPGGNFFSVDNQWYIPFQNHTEGYGTGISLYKLKNDSFERVIFRQLYKSDSIDSFGRGMHHLNVNMINRSYYLVYDGDQINYTRKKLTWISSIKFNLYDIYNFIFR